MLDITSFEDIAKKLVKKDMLNIMIIKIMLNMIIL